MKIIVIGAGYVGMSLAVLLSRKSEVLIIDVNEVKVSMINAKQSPIKDEYIEKFLTAQDLNLISSTNLLDSFKSAEYAIICTPTNYDETTKSFDTSSIDKVVKEVLNFNKNINIIIKSTIPIGYMNILQKKYKANFLFSPEFLREGNALYDNLYPSRIIVSPENNISKDFAKLLCESAEKQDIPVMLMNYDEAASVKLFSNSYLAMRVAFFNELDTFCEQKNLDSKKIIEGVCYDKRIGNYYNNPSFGFGGYCLPKDTKQLISNYDKIPQNIIKSIIESNTSRKKHIASNIIMKHPKTVGVYRLIMKNNSDNYRMSAIFDIINMLCESNIKIIIYEPLLNSKEKIKNCEILNDIKKFKIKSDLIICNRIDEELKDVVNKVYTRDIYTRD